MQSKFSEGKPEPTHTTARMESGKTVKDEKTGRTDSTGSNSSW